MTYPAAARHHTHTHAHTCRLDQEVNTEDVQGCTAKNKSLKPVEVEASVSFVTTKQFVFFDTAQVDFAPPVPAADCTGLKKERERRRVAMSSPYS